MNAAMSSTCMGFMYSKSQKNGRSSHGVDLVMERTLKKKNKKSSLPVFSINNKAVYHVHTCIHNRLEDELELHIWKGLFASLLFMKYFHT